MTTTDQPHNAATVLAVILLLLFIVKIVAKELLNDIVYVYHWIRQIATDTVPKDDITSTSALRYFCASFNHPELLIKVMAKNNFVLSGSRALEYFVPGSTSMTSDWDFYIPNNEACIAGAMHTLAKCGVVWTDWIAPFRNLLDAERRRHCTRIGRPLNSSPIPGCNSTSRKAPTATQLSPVSWMPYPVRSLTLLPVSPNPKSWTALSKWRKPSFTSMPVLSDTTLPHAQRL